MDHMTSQTKMAIRHVRAQGEQQFQKVLEEVFPEYADIKLQGSRTQHWKGKAKSAFQLSNRDNQLFTEREFSGDRFDISGSGQSQLQYGTNRFRPEVQMYQSRSPHSSFTVGSTSSLTPHIGISHTLSSLLGTPHLVTLARLIVERTAKKTEKARRERLKLNCASAKDLTIERERLAKGKGKGEWRLDEDEVDEKVQRLFNWGLRCVAEDGEVVEVNIRSTENNGSCGCLLIRSNHGQDGSHHHCHASQDLVPAYVPLPPNLILPLLLPHLTAETQRRRRIFIPKTDKRFGQGILLEEILVRLQAWGVNGRWERVGDWVIEAALRFGEEIEDQYGLKRVGKGWVANDEYG